MRNVDERRSMYTAGRARPNMRGQIFDSYDWVVFAAEKGNIKVATYLTRGVCITSKEHLQDVATKANENMERASTGSIAKRRIREEDYQSLTHGHSR